MPPANPPFRIECSPSPTVLAWPSPVWESLSIPCARTDPLVSTCIVGEQSKAGAFPEKKGALVDLLLSEPPGVIPLRFVLHLEEATGGRQPCRFGECRPGPRIYSAWS